MRVNAALVLKLRKERSWSQDELATASGLNLRTIQRIETSGSASLQSKKAVAAALDIHTRDLDGEGVHMKPSMACPACGSKEIYRYKKYFQSPGSASGETLLPGLGTLLRVARVCPTVCYGCGHVRIFAAEEDRQKLKTSKHWTLVGA